MRELTRLLTARGYLERAGATFDGAVRGAVLGFQAWHVDARGQPLVADGVVGPLTWWALVHPRNPAVLNTPVTGALTQMPPNGGSRRGRAALKVALAGMAAGAREEGANNDGKWVRKYLHGIVFTIEGNKGGFPARVRPFDYVLSRIDKLLGFGRVPF